MNKKAKKIINAQEDIVKQTIAGYCRFQQDRIHQIPGTQVIVRNSLDKGNSHKNSGFFFFKKGTDLSAPFSQPFSFLGRTAFFIFLEQYPAPEKGRWGKWRLKLKNSNKANSKPNRTRPEYRSHTGPPAQTEKPICTASLLCEGCPFPGHGFLCQGVDGECMRTRLMKLSEKEDTK